MKQTIQTIGVLIYRNNKEVLLVRHKESASHLTDTYGLPAGRSNENESEIETAIRELEEETGLLASEKHLKKLPKTYYAEIKRKEETKTFSLELFLCKSYSGELKSTDEIEPLWVKTEDIDNYNLLPNVKQIITENMQFQ